MNRKRVRAELPEAYAGALRLRRAGVPAPQIAAELGLEPEAVPPLLSLAEAKLATLAERRASDERAAAGVLRASYSRLGFCCWARCPPTRSEPPRTLSSRVRGTGRCTTPLG